MKSHAKNRPWTGIARRLTAYLLAAMIAVIVMGDWHAVGDPISPVSLAADSTVRRSAPARSPGKEDLLYHYGKRRSSRGAHHRQHLPPYVAPRLEFDFTPLCPLRCATYRPVVERTLPAHTAHEWHPNFRAPPAPIPS
ncbi:MAG TPA: hypothetical protein VM490_01240 [Armatimonadaceae bacterium]|nr:hypothetical protein [Armatimonadaceae bacterium]